MLKMVLPLLQPFEILQLLCTFLATYPTSLVSIMSFTTTGTLGFFWLAVSSQWSAVSWALTPPIEIHSNGKTLKNSSADKSISLQIQSNLSTIANQTTFLSSTASKR